MPRQAMAPSTPGPAPSATSPRPPCPDAPCRRRVHRQPFASLAEAACRPQHGAAPPVIAFGGQNPSCSILRNRGAGDTGPPACDEAMVPLEGTMPDLLCLEVVMPEPDCPEVCPHRRRRPLQGGAANRPTTHQRQGGAAPAARALGE